MKVTFSYSYHTIVLQWAVPGEVTYDISLIYGYNVGMEISTGDSSCYAFACDISSGCVSSSTLFGLSRHTDVVFLLVQACAWTSWTRRNDVL